jgi:hypothetical protein
MVMKPVRFLGSDCVIEKRRYANGRPALVLNEAGSGELFAVATVNLPDVPAAPNQVFIKDYSENEGILAVVEAAGVVKSMNVRISTSFASLPICELLPPYQERVLAETYAQVRDREGQPAQQQSKDHEFER